MSWRRIAPWVIGVVALVAIFIDLPAYHPRPRLAPDQVGGVEFKTVLGLDLKGGIRVTLEAEPQSDEPITTTDMETARTIIEKRVAGIGVSEPQVRTEVGGDGSQRIVAEVPGVDDPEQVRRLVGSTGRLEFLDPRGQQLTDGQDVGSSSRMGPFGVLFDGGEIDIASVTPPSVDGNIIGVQFSLAPADQIWCQFTSANVDARTDRARRRGHHRADDRGAICGGQTIITVGPQTPRTSRAHELYNTLRFGALPISLTEQGVETVDPTLGADFLARR